MPLCLSAPLPLLLTAPYPPRLHPLPPIALIGGGGHALVVASVAALSGRAVAGFFDDDPGAVCATKLGLSRLGGLMDAARLTRAHVILALGSIALRRNLLREWTHLPFTNVLWCDPALLAHHRVTIGAGVFLGIQSVVQPFAAIGDHAIINTGAIIEHECRVGVNVHVAPGAVLGGNSHVGDDSLVGLGARVLPGVRIGKSCVVAAGATVTRDVADGVKVAGTPAQPISAGHTSAQ